MRSSSVLATLVAFFAVSASSQQYAGDVIDTNLMNVPGSEIAFFKIPGVMDSNKKKAANLTLINYYSHGSTGKRLDESKVQRAVIIIHGLNRDPGTYESNMISALAQVTGDSNINKDSVAIMSPYFPNGDDKKAGYPWTDGLSPGRGSTTSALVWKGSQWASGGNNQYPYYSQTTSSYTVLDTLVQYFDDRTLFPNMKQIVVAGHSLGAQTVHRYAALGQNLNTKSPVTYWIGNPNSYVWLSTDRPLSTATCPTYDYYREGYTNFTEYPMTYGQSLVSQGRSAILANYNSKQIAYARGTQDDGDDSSSCAPFTTGSNRNERFFNFIKAFPVSCTDPQGSNCDTIDFVNMGHDGGGMFASDAGRARLFTDNFYGNGNRSYDFGYPRQQDGDDPFPDPALNMTSSSLNNITYAGNMTYAGCWSEGGVTRTFPTQAYDNSSNTIELCTSTCVSRGFSIAGLEFGSQCYCGNAMTSGAVKVIESSCKTPCAGNSSESCGGMSRLSVFSNGTPYVLAPASNPETVGKFYYSNCYTETSSRTLTAKVSRGSFMTLEYCADFCSSYKYFGTEYSSECYCGNTIDPLASIAPAGECGMTCANNTLEYCGAGNRLTLFTNPDWVQPTGSSTSSTSSTPTASGTPSGPACPASNNTVVVSNGLKFIVECGIDHAGGDLTTVYDTTFQQCIDACSSNSQCVDVSLSGSACYLKKAVGSVVNIPGVWGARLLTDSSSTTSTTTSSSTGTSSSLSSSATSLSSSGTTTSYTTSASSSSTPSDISCPASDATTYTGSSGQSFFVECGIDHQGGDMGMKYVSSFQQCIDACDKTTGCVDVSLSGEACYMKSSLGPAVNAPSIWGAKLVSPPASSTSSGSTSSSSLASSSTSTSSSTSADASSSSSSTSSSANTSATATAVSCPASNDTLYTVASGSTFQIECGIDHQGDDLSSKSVSSFAECISLCDRTAGCVDVSLSGGYACYLKNAVGPVVKLDYIWGAKLVAASSSSSSSSSLTTTSSSSSTSASSSSSSPSSSSLTTTTTVTPSDDASSSTSLSSSSSSTTSSSSSSSTLDSTTTSLRSSSTDSTSDSTTSSGSAPTSTSSGSTDSSTTTSSSTSTGSSSTSSSSSGVDSSASSTSSTSSSSTSTSETTSSSSTSSTVEATSTTTDSSSGAASTSTDSTSSTMSTSTDSSSSTTSSSTTSSSSSETSLSTSTTTTSSTSASSIDSSSSTTSSSATSSFSSTIPLSSSAATTSSSSSGFTTVTTSTTSSSAASSSTASLPSGFSYTGCFIDGSTRALPVSAGTSSSQTQQQCAMSCQAKGYKYSGTEYGSECWCGNSIPSSPAPESQCSKVCSGDSTQKCGAGNRLSVVSDDSWKQTFFARQSFGAYNLLGCYTDSTAKRSLPTSVSLAAYGGGANASIANCVQACQAKGFTYCGAEYYSECFGSNVAPSTNLAGSDPLAAGCNYPCKGNSTESCGGSIRIIVYSNAGN